MSHALQGHHPQVEYGVCGMLSACFMSSNAPPVSCWWIRLVYSEDWDQPCHVELLPKSESTVARDFQLKLPVPAYIVRPSPRLLVALIFIGIADAEKHLSFILNIFLRQFRGVS
jgi:hypothetical protein